MGAGDAMIGGVLAGLARGETLADSFRCGVAAGAASVMTDGTQLLRRPDFEGAFAQGDRAGSMKTDFERAFIRAGHRGQALLQDDLIALVPREYGGHVAQLGGAKSLVFDIVMGGSRAETAGEIALRVGEDASCSIWGISATT